MIEQTLEPTDTKTPAFTAIAATTGVTVWGYQTEGDNQKADVNGDGKINAADVTAVMNVISGNGNNQKADVNNDGKVNISDIITIITIINNS